MLSNVRDRKNKITMGECRLREELRRHNRVTVDGDRGIVELTRGYRALVDAKDVPRVRQYSWHALTAGARNRTVYAVTTTWPRGSSPSKKPGIIYLHRLLLGLSPGDRRIVDHRNMNGLDCRRSNLRLATNQQNLANRGHQKNNKLGVKGVSPHGGFFMACIKVNRKTIYLGLYKTVEEAACAYNNAAAKHFGAFAKGSETVGAAEAHT